MKYWLMFSTVYNLWTFTWFVHFELPFSLKGTEKIHTERFFKFPSNIYSILYGSPTPPGVSLYAGIAPKLFNLNRGTPSVNSTEHLQYGNSTVHLQYGNSTVHLQYGNSTTKLRFYTFFDFIPLYP